MSNFCLRKDPCHLRGVGGLSRAEQRADEVTGCGGERRLASHLLQDCALLPDVCGGEGWGAEARVPGHGSRALRAQEQLVLCLPLASVWHVQTLQKPLLGPSVSPANGVCKGSVQGEGWRERSGEREGVCV